MSNLKFETNSFGIKQCIINTQHRWLPFNIVTGKQVTIEIYNDEIPDGDEREYYILPIDFETNNYYRMIEQEKDQIIVYYFPIKMMFGFE